MINEVCMELSMIDMQKLSIICELLLKVFYHRPTETMTVMQYM